MNIVKPILTLLTLLAVAPAALACNEHDHGGDKPRPAAKASARIEGTIREVDVERGSLALSHGPIPGLRMKRMDSMVVKVDPSIGLDRLHPGDAIRFRLRIAGGLPLVTEIDKTVMR